MYKLDAKKYLLNVRITQEPHIRFLQKLDTCKLKCIIILNYVFEGNPSINLGRTFFLNFLKLRMTQTILIQKLQKFERNTITYISNFPQSSKEICSDIYNICI